MSDHPFHSIPWHRQAPSLIFSVISGAQKRPSSPPHSFAAIVSVRLHFYTFRNLQVRCTSWRALLRGCIPTCVSNAFSTDQPFASLGMVLGRRSSSNVSAMKDEFQCKVAVIEKNPVQSSSDITSHGLLPEGLYRSSLPERVAMVLDGHSRWAEKRGLPTEAGHRQGITILLPKIVEPSSRWGIEALTVYAFSTKNWSRPKDRRADDAMESNGMDGQTSNTEVFNGVTVAEKEDALI